MGGQGPANAPLPFCQGFRSGRGAWRDAGGPSGVLWAPKRGEGGGRRRVLRACLGQPRKRSHQRPGGRRQSCAAQKHVFTEDRFESSPWNLTRQEPRTAENRRGPRPLRSSS